MTWLTILVTWPAPVAPIWVASPRSFRTAFTREKTVFSPPTMIARVPASADWRTAGDRGVDPGHAGFLHASRSAKALVVSTGVVE